MNPVAKILVWLFVGATLVFSLVLMPAAELMPATVTPGPIAPGLSPVRSESIMDAFKDLGQKIWGTDNLKNVVDHPLPDGAPGDVSAYLMYSYFLAGALACAAIAINAVGRYDSEEKTTIPVKK